MFDDINSTLTLTITSFHFRKIVNLDVFLFLSFASDGSSSSCYAVKRKWLEKGESKQKVQKKELWEIDKDELNSANDEDAGWHYSMWTIST